MVPEGAAEPMPLLVWLHGAGGDAPGMLRMLEPQALPRGCLAVIPGAAHAISFSYPREFKAEILGFLLGGETLPSITARPRHAAYRLTQGRVGHQTVGTTGSVALLRKHHVRGMPPRRHARADVAAARAPWLRITAQLA